jgi:hypothetical protein
MASHESLKWRLRAPPHPDVDAVEFALGCDAAAVLYGPHPFDFTKTRLANGDLRLALSPDGHGDAGEGIAPTHILGSLVAEVDVPEADCEHDPNAFSQRTAKPVLALGRALFNDVARMVDVFTRVG